MTLISTLLGVSLMSGLITSDAPPTAPSSTPIAVYDLSTMEGKKEYAKIKIEEEFGEDHWSSFDVLINKESGWSNTIKNPNSTAYGIGQFLNSTWSSVGCVKTDDAKTQIDCTISYVKQRYGNPSKALAFHRLKNWY